MISTQQDTALRLKCTFSRNRKQHQPFTTNQSLSVLLFYDVLLPWEVNTCRKASFKRQSQIGHPYGTTGTRTYTRFLIFVWIFHFHSLSLLRCLLLIAALRSGKSNEIFIGLKVRGDALIQSSVYWDSGKHQRRGVPRPHTPERIIFVALCISNRVRIFSICVPS